MEVTDPLKSVGWLSGSGYQVVIDKNERARSRKEHHKMDVREMQTFLDELLDIHGTDPDYENPVKSVRTFSAAGVLTNDMGLVVKLEDGSRFQITITPQTEAQREETDLRAVNAKLLEALEGLREDLQGRLDASSEGATVADGLVDGEAANRSWHSWLFDVMSTHGNIAREAVKEARKCPECGDSRVVRSKGAQKDRLLSCSSCRNIPNK